MQKAKQLCPAKISVIWNYIKQGKPYLALVLGFLYMIKMKYIIGAILFTSASNNIHINLALGPPNAKSFSSLFMQSISVTIHNANKPMLMMEEKMMEKIMIIKNKDPKIPVRIPIIASITVYPLYSFDNTIIL